MVVAAYRRWSITRCFNGKALTGKVLRFWMSGRLWEAGSLTRGGCTWRFNCRLEFSHDRLKRSRMYVVSIWAMLRHIDIEVEQNKHLLESLQHVLANF